MRKELWDMNNSIIYRPLTATPFKRNSFYTEISPSKELQSYIRCYWGTEKPLIQIENNDAPELVIPDTCPIYDCVRNNKCMQNCGECGEVPCKIWFDTRDPKFSDEEFNENIAMRVQALKKE